MADEPSNSKSTTSKDHDEFDLLSAIWIIASNDPIQIIVYEELVERLGLPNDGSGLRYLQKLVASRRELFRTSGGDQLLEAWHEAQKKGEQIPDRIKRLTTDRFFRSQFRTQIALRAQKSPIEIIDWGLQHIDRLRTASIQAREEEEKRVSSVWVPIWTSVIAAIVALGGIGLTQYFSLQNLSTQLASQVKQNEIQIKIKHNLNGTK